MNWKEQLSSLEKNKQWDEAIEFMKRVVQYNPNDMDAYIFMNYLLMNLLVEENHDESKHGYYASLTKEYFDISHRKFSNNPEYLFFTGITAVMSEWYFGISMEDYQNMLKKATELDPQNKLYCISYYFGSVRSKTPNIPQELQYADILLDPNDSVQKQLATKGAAGEYYLELMTGIAEKIILENIESYIREIRQAEPISTQRINSLTLEIQYIFRKIKSCDKIEYAERYLKALDLIQQCLHYLIHIRKITLPNTLVHLAENWPNIYSMKEHYYVQIRCNNKQH